MAPRDEILLFRFIVACLKLLRRRQNQIGEVELIARQLGRILKVQLVLILELIFEHLRQRQQRLGVRGP